MKLRLLFLLLFFSLTVYSQEIRFFNPPVGQPSEFEFFVDAQHETQPKLLGSSSVFFDQEYGVQAFSFYLDGRIDQLEIVQTHIGNLLIQAEKNYSQEDNAIDGSSRFPKQEKFKKTDFTFPIFSLKPQPKINGKEITLLVVRPWQENKGQLQLIKSIRFKSSRQIEKLDSKELVRLKQKANTSSFMLNTLVNGFNFDKNFSTSYRIIINKTGIAKITAKDVLSFDPQTKLTTADSRTIRLYNRGTEIPILMNDGNDNEFSGDDYFEFFSEEQLYKYKNPKKDLWVDPFTNENVYFLVFDQNLTSDNKGSRLVEFSGEAREFIPITNLKNLKGRSFPTTLHFEQNNRPELLGSVDTTKNYDYRDHIFWDRINLNEKKKYATPIPGIDGNAAAEAMISIALHGITYVNLAGLNKEHNVKAQIGTSNLTLSLSDIREGSSGWNGQNLNIVRYAIPMNDLSTVVGSGASAQLEIENYDPIYPNTQISRYFHLNWIDVTYNRKYEAYQNQLKFRAPTGTPGTYQFTIDFFSNPQIEIYKKGIGKVVNYTLESYISDAKTQKLSYRVIMQDYVVNTETTEYLALTESSKIKPLRFEKVYPSVLLDENKTGSDKKLSLKNPNRDESFIIITSNQFWTPDFASEFNPIRQYAAYREEVLGARSLTNPDLQGRSAQVMITTTTDIFDEFNNGIKSPYAIRDFLNFAFHYWKKPPMYVLLLGDASSQYYTTADKVTTMMVQTVQWGAAASDAWFGMVDGDDIIPDIHIGRIPATGFTDIYNYLDKLKFYEQVSAKEKANNSVLFISGDERSFIADNNDLLLQADKSFFNNNIHVLADSTGDPNFGSRTDLVRYWSDGQAVVNFMGHGASGAWNDRGFLDDARAIKSFADYKLPFVTSMTCFTGAFNAGAGLVNLSEFFVVEPKKGAIGSLASSSLGWRLNDKYLVQSIYQYLLNPDYQNLTIGEIIDLGKLSYRARYSDYFNTPFRIPNSMIHQYNVLGDPAVILNFPKSKLTLDKNEVLISDNPKLNLTVSSNHISNGTLYAKFADAGNRDLLGQPTQISFSNNAASVELDIPSSIKNSKSEGYLKFYLNDQNKEANASVRFSYGDVLIRKVYAQNEPIVENGKLKFIAEVESNKPIQHVRFNYTIYNPIDQDKFTDSNSGGNSILLSGTLNMTSTGNNWITTDSIPSPFVSSQYRISWEVVVTDISQKQYFKSGNYFLQDLPDISVVRPGQTSQYENPTIGIYYKNGVKLGAEISNKSALDVEKVFVNFYRDGVTETEPPQFYGNQILLGSTEIELKKNQSAYAYIDLPPSFVAGEVANVSVQAFADTTNGKREKTYMNNLSWPKQLLVTVFLVNASVDSSVLSANGYDLTFKSTFAENTSLLISSTNNFIKKGQDLLIPVGLKNNPNQSISIQPFAGNSLVEFSGYSTLKVQANTTVDILKKSGLYFFETRSQRWAQVKTQSIDTTDLTISASIHHYGLYQIFQNQDSEPPTVTVSVNGRILKPNHVVSHGAKFAFVVQDANGLIPDRSYFNISIDGNPIEPSTINLPDSLSDGNQMMLSFDKNLELGNHVLSYSFTDANKNVRTVTDLNFVVSDDESVTFYGGFPNPFQSEQIFAFKINGVGANWVRLKIYTVSGQLINTFDSAKKADVPSFVPKSGGANLYDKIPDSKSSDLPADYFEIYWDGTDRDGNDVAYGVYYVKLSVKLETGKVIEKIFKSARAPK